MQVVRTEQKFGRAQVIARVLEKIYGIESVGRSKDLSCQCGVMCSGELSNAFVQRRAIK